MSLRVGRRLFKEGHGGRSSVSGLTVTVFGATGFVGRYVVNKFGRIGSRVLIPYRGSEKDFEHLKVMGDLGQIVPTPFHLHHKESIRRAVQHADVVVNLIGSPYDTKRFSIEEATQGAAEKIAQACVDAPHVQKLILVSSVHADPNSISRVQRAKAQAEQISVDLLGKRATILRSTQLFGDEDRFFNRLGGAARYWPFVPQLPNRQIAPVYVADLADAVVAAAQSQSSGTFELQGPRKYDQDTVFGELCRVMRLSPTFVPLPPSVMRLGAKIMGSFSRKPLMTEDELLLMPTDDVASGALPDAAAEFGIDLTPMESVAINTIRVYRPPSQFYDIRGEDEEEVARSEQARLAPRDFSRLTHALDTTSRHRRAMLTSNTTKE